MGASLLICALSICANDGLFIYPVTKEARETRWYVLGSAAISTIPSIMIVGKMKKDKNFLNNSELLEKVCYTIFSYFLAYFGSEIPCFIYQ